MHRLATGEREWHAGQRTQFSHRGADVQCLPEHEGASHIRDCSDSSRFGSSNLAQPEPGGHPRTQHADEDKDAQLPCLPVRANEMGQRTEHSRKYIGQWILDDKNWTTVSLIRFRQPPRVPLAFPELSSEVMLVANVVLGIISLRDTL